MDRTRPHGEEGWGDEPEGTTPAGVWAARRFSRHTWKAYRARVHAFWAWCAAHERSGLDERALGDWIAFEADRGRSAVWISQAASGVLAWWSDRGGPVTFGAATATIEGVRRTLRAETRHEPTEPLELEVWARACAALRESHTLTDTRDRALLVLGFLLAARAGELSELRAVDVREVRDDVGRGGLEVVVRHGKRSLGPVAVVLPAGREVATCPVDAWRRLRALVRDHPYALPGTHYEVIQAHGVSIRTIPRVVARCGELGGHAGGGRGLSAHSLRAGLAHAMVARGASVAEVQAVGRWRSLAGLLPYLREQRAWEVGRALSGRLGY